MTRDRKYEEAMQAVTGPQSRELKCHSLLQVGRTYVDYLLARGDYDVAARLCVNILGPSLLSRCHRCGTKS